MIEILEQTSDYLVCVKPRGLDTQQGLVDALAGQGICPVFLVHRLDKETAGVILLAKNQKAAAEFSRQITEGRMQKEYLALVWGTPDPPEGQWEDLLFRDAAKNKSYVVKRMRRGVRKALLTYQICQTGQLQERPVSLLRIRLQTGRTHQIRVQCASRGMPLVGDSRYGGGKDLPLCLWAEPLTFYGSDQKLHTVTAPVPPEHPMRTL